MPYIGNKTADTTLVEDNSITSAKIVNDAVTKDKTDLITDSGGASLEAKGSSGYDGAVRLNCSVNSHYTELKSASHGSYSGNLSFTLPSSTGTNGQVLQTNGSGVLSFADAPSGAMTLITRASGSSNVGNISLDNVFSDTYDYYKIFMWTNAPTSGGDFRFRWRKSGSDRTDSYYTYVSCVSQTSSSSSSIIVTNQSINLDYHNLFNNANSNANLGDITVLTIIDPRARDEGNVATLLSENSNYRQDSVWRSFRGAGFYGNQGSGDDFDGFKVYYTNSDINYYDYAIYGMNKT